jgi:hypothetical protein
VSREGREGRKRQDQKIFLLFYGLDLAFEFDFNLKRTGHVVAGP